MILQRRRHIHYCCIYFRVTTLLADSTLPTSHCRPVPHSSGGLFLDYSALPLIEAARRG